MRSAWPRISCGWTSPYVLGTDERNVVAVGGLIKVDQGTAVDVLLLGHAGEDLPHRRLSLEQPVRVFGVDPGVLLAKRDRQRQHFALIEVGKAPHAPPFLPPSSLGSLEHFQYRSTCRTTLPTAPDGVAAYFLRMWPRNGPFAPSRKVIMTRA